MKCLRQIFGSKVKTGGGCFAGYDEQGKQVYIHGDR